MSTSERRGVLYLVWEGQEPRVKEALERSLASVWRWHPELPVRVAQLPEGSTLLDKAEMAERSPFAETLFLDADTVLLGRLDYGFEQAGRHGLACCICECPWARRYPACAKTPDLPEYNTGVIFFTAAAGPMFERWRVLNAEIDSSILFRGPDEQLLRMPRNDQAGFALALNEWGFNPFVLPLNWNFRPKWHKGWFGPVRVWHDYDPVPEALLEWNAQQEAAGAIMQFAVGT